MNDDVITNKMLLEHMQANDSAILRRIDALEKKVDKGFAYMHERFISIDKEFAEVDRQFRAAKQHRDNLQEDLEATIKMQFRHETELAVLTGRPRPEDD